MQPRFFSWFSGLKPLQRLGGLLAFCVLLYVAGLTTLPPFDRDEARYIQASRQMLETGNYTQPAFQNEPRLKKPAGIYWLQVASVKLAAFGNKQALWVYRLPSVVAALLAVTVVTFMGWLWFTPAVGLLAATWLALSPLMVAEAHLAKTDATLLALTLLMQLGLGQLVLSPSPQERLQPPHLQPPKGLWLLWAFVFWSALACGLMVKGPVMLVLAGFTGVACWFLLPKQRYWVQRLQLPLGLALAALLVVPWFWHMHHSTHGTFWYKFFVEDIWSKLSSVQESHGAPPGTYLLSSFLLLLPGSLWAWQGLQPALKMAFAKPVLKGEAHLYPSPTAQALLFLLAWAAPTWVFFELAPTKLPHYVLPLLPAVLLMASYGVLNTATPTASKSMVTSVVAKTAWQNVARWFQQVFVKPFQQKTLPLALTLSVLLGLASMVLTQWALPAFKPFWVSPQLAAATQSVSKQKTATTLSPYTLYLLGYHEPSAVVLLGTPVHLSAPETFLQEALQAKQPVIWVWLEDRLKPAFQQALKQYFVSSSPSLAHVQGLNYSRAQWVHLYLYQLTLPNKAPVS